MDKLLEQVAQTLKIPTDALQTVINNYPLIRQEYAVYKALEVVSFVVGFMVILNTIISCIFAFIILGDAYEHKEHDINRHKVHRKTFYISIATLIVSIVIIIACGVASAFLAPDIHLIKDLINR